MEINLWTQETKERLSNEKGNDASYEEEEEVEEEDKLRNRKEKVGVGVVGDSM